MYKAFPKVKVYVDHFTKKSWNSCNDTKINPHRLVGVNYYLFHIILFPPEIIHEFTDYIVGEFLIFVGDIPSLSDRLERVVN